MAQQKCIPTWDTKTSYIDCAQARHLPQTCEPLNCRLWAPVELHHISFTHIHTHTHTHTCASTHYVPRVLLGEHALLQVPDRDGSTTI